MKPDPKSLPPANRTGSSDAPVPAAPYPDSIQQVAPAQPAADLWDERDQGPDLRRYISALSRYRWLVVLVTVLGTAAGVGATRLLVPEYQTQATVWVEGSAGLAGEGPIRATQLLNSSSWIELLKSFVVLDYVIVNERLFVTVDDPERGGVLRSMEVADTFRPGAYHISRARGGGVELFGQNGRLVERAAPGDSLGRVIGLRWVPPVTELSEDGLDFSLQPPREAATRLAAELIARMDLNGNFLRVELKGRDPERTAGTLNAVLERYVSVAGELKRRQLEEQTSILRLQLQDADQHLRESELEIENFRVQTATLPRERPGTALAPGLLATRDPIFGSYFQLAGDREQLRRDREEITRIVTEARDSSLGVEALAIVPSVQQTSGLSEAMSQLAARRSDVSLLLLRYTDQHPPVQALLTEISALEKETIPQLARALMGDLQRREAELATRIQSIEADLAAIPPRMIEEARLARDVTIAENLYTAVQSRYEEARLGAASSIPDLRILDRATVPQRPKGSRAMLLSLVAFVGSVGAGLLAAILLDRLDPRVQYPEQVTHDMGLQILGAVPHIGNGKQSGSEEGMLHVMEAIRGIRLNLVHAYGSAGPVLLTITSPGSGDGKSFMAVNLALSFADLGHSTLLVDADVRRGELHQVLGAQRKPGLTNYLAGEVPLTAILQTTKYKSLQMIGCGTRMRSGPELLNSAEMAHLIGSARANYSVVVVDTPPLGAAADPYVISTLTGNALIVLRTGTTDRELAEAKLDMLERLPVRILGAILNDVRASGAYRHYYYSHYSYLPGYEAKDEEGTEVEPVG